MSGPLTCPITRGLGGDIAVTILELLLDGPKFHNQGRYSEWHERCDRETSLFPKGQNPHEEVRDDVHGLTRYHVSRHAESLPRGRVGNGQLTSVKMTDVRSSIRVRECNFH